MMRPSAVARSTVEEAVVVDSFLFSDRFEHSFREDVSMDVMAIVSVVEGYPHAVQEIGADLAAKSRPTIEARSGTSGRPGCPGRSCGPARGRTPRIVPGHVVSRSHH